LAALAQKTLYPEAISINRSHQHYCSNPTLHGFSFDDAVDTANLDLPDWFRRQSPNSEHDQYRLIVRIFDIPGSDMFYLGPIRNQQVLAEEYIFLDQNLKDFQWLDRSQIFAMLHLQPKFVQLMPVSHHIQQVVLGSPLIQEGLEGQSKR
jgi:hypothetical protein